MKAKLICYTLEKADHQKRSKFKRELIGYTDKSNKGEYKYERKGLLSTIPHNKPIRSVIIVENKNAQKIIDFLRKYQAQIKTYDTIINKTELTIPQDATP